MKPVSFILNNNNFLFDSQLYHQLEGTGMGVDFAAAYACLTIGYLEEVFLFPKYLPLYFTREQRQLIQNAFYRYMDDGFIIWPKDLDITQFMKALNKLHAQIKYTVDVGEKDSDKQVVNMLDIAVILHNSNKIETDIYYKDTNTHHYLHYNSRHPEHIKKNIPYNLAKRIIIFTFDDKKMNIRLTELKLWLQQCSYPIEVINKAFHNAKLQAPPPTRRGRTKYCRLFLFTPVITLITKS